MTVVKRLILSGLVAASLLAAPSLEDLKVETTEFDMHWTAFMEDLFGCVRSNGSFGNIDDNCDPAKSRVNIREFSRAKDAAKVIFELEDRK